LVPAFDLSIRLRIVWRGSHMRHSADANEFFEVFGDELGPVVADDPGFGIYCSGKCDGIRFSFIVCSSWRRWWPSGGG
jgi:hypothetical protein